MQRVTILLVEGKGAGKSSLTVSLEKTGCNLIVVNTGTEALTVAESMNLQMIVFDASTMRSNGSRTCRRLRTHLERKALIHCRKEDTAKDLSILADVYLERPFTPRKFLNRVYELLPVDDLSEEIIRCGDITFYRNKRTVDVAGQGEQHLTPKLAHLLDLFLRHPGEVVSRRLLMQEVWKTDYLGDPRTLDVHIRWVREHIEHNPQKPQMLKTVRGKGYVFNRL